MVTGADILAKARSYIGKFHDGPDVPRMAQAIGQTFPDLASYGKQASNSTPWCGIFCAYVLSQFSIKPPPVKDGVGYMYVNRWLDFGTSVPVGQEKAGDLALWLNTPHHISFVTGTGRYVGGNQGNAVTEGAYRKPDAIRRAPVSNEKPVPGRQYGITATFFNDTRVAYQDVKPGWNDRYGVSLPYRFKGVRPKVRVFKDGRHVDCEIVDIGPWYDGTDERGPYDPYWETGKRPRAESDPNTNGAGIDLTPAAADAIDLGGKAVVDWEFIKEAVKPPPDDEEETLSNAAVEAALKDVTTALRPILEKHMEKPVTQQTNIDWGKLLQPLLAELAPKIVPLILPYVMQMLPQLMPYLLDALFKPRQSVMSKPGVQAGAAAGVGGVIGAILTAIVSKGVQ